MTSVAIGLHSGKLIAVLATLFAGVAAALSVPPLRSVIEQSMAWHMVFQMPLLVLAGALAYLALPPRFGSRRLAIIKQVNQFNHFGLTGFMAAQVIIAYWMLPMAIDRAVVQPPFDAIKLATLFTSGMLLADAFKRAPSVLQLFFMGYWVSMMCWLGIYFATTDLRLCNAYSLQSQVATGWGLLALGLLLGVVWVAVTGRTLLKNAIK
jgi:hypothetical protein